MTKPVTCSYLQGMEVVTERMDDGSYVTVIFGGRLDGERFECGPDGGAAESQHRRACQLVRTRGRIAS